MNYEKICYWAYLFLIGSCGVFFLAVAYLALFGDGIEYAWNLKLGCAK